MKYIDLVVDSINKATNKKENILFYGENLNFGSCLGGMGRGLKASEKSLILNVQNSELTHVGLGLGMMLDKGNAILFVKQLDFLLLALDQICNTYNYIRAANFKKDLGSFTIISIVCDHGFQGPQSSLNAGGDLSSIANLPVYCLNQFADITDVISSEILKPGFRIFTISQRAIPNSVDMDSSISISSDKSIFHYLKGDLFTMVCVNFSLNRYSLRIQNIYKNNIRFDLFHINYLPGQNYEMILESVRKTKKLIIIDDGKSNTKLADNLVSKLVSLNIRVDLINLHREILNDKEYAVCNDQPDINFEKIINKWI